MNSYYIATWYRLSIGWKIPMLILVPRSPTDTYTWKLIWIDTDTYWNRYPQKCRYLPILLHISTSNYSWKLKFSNLWKRVLCPLPLLIVIKIFDNRLLDLQFGVEIYGRILKNMLGWNFQIQVRGFRSAPLPPSVVFKIFSDWLRDLEFIKLYGL